MLCVSPCIIHFPLTCCTEHRIFVKAIAGSFPVAVQIKFFASLRKAAGVDGVELNAKTVDEALKELQRRYRGNEVFLKMLKTSNAILNGNNIAWMKGLRTPLADNDELTFFPPVGGG